MKSDQIKWNQKFAERNHLLPAEPFLLRELKAEPGLSLLDLASGDGRNAIHFARLGFSVTAVDISDFGISKIDVYSKAENLNIETIQADFDDLSFLSYLKTYDVVIFNHFKPSHELWIRLHELLNDNGRVFLCAFNEQHHHSFGFPIDYCLKIDEFVDANPNLRCEFHLSYFEDEKYLDAYIFTRA